MPTIRLDEVEEGIAFNDSEADEIRKAIRRHLEDVHPIWPNKVVKSNVKSIGRKITWQVIDRTDFPDCAGVHLLTYAAM